jgi:hypothetical protein
MKPDNPFADWLTSDPYDGTWVTVGRLGGWLGAAHLPVLFRRGAEEAMLASTEWPFQLDEAGPKVFDPTVGARRERHANLHPARYCGETPIEPLAVMFDPPARRAWLEPVQSFALFYGAAPRLKPDGQIEWEIADEDGKPEVIARWTRTPDTEHEGVLTIRRDKLLRFMTTFGFDLAIYFEENRADNSVDGDWRDEEREPDRYWRCWASAGFTEDTRVVSRCVTVLRAPELDGNDYEQYDESTLEYVIGTDPATGKPVTAAYPDAPNDKTTWEGAGRNNFLTPVIFRREVLDYYLDDPRHYAVTEREVRAGNMWSIPIAITERGNVHVWLGDLGRISDTAQQHWRRYNIADDDGVPEWRIEQDINAQFVDPPPTEPLDRLGAAIHRCNELALRYCGQPLYAKIEGLSADRVRTLRVPLNSSLPAFQDQVTTLAITVIEHLNADFFAAAAAPAGPGTLSRLAAWLEAETGAAEEDAKAMIGGLHAVQAIRSKAGGAHRGGSAGIEALSRAEIDLDDLPAGFEHLVGRVTASLEAVADVLECLAPKIS